ncbi:MAG TPA: cold shock domain-containing protein [Xanthobacteraceae bacterium]|nr:cold shock domain-containing protein [Xanthobacteraceae bacterium]
MFLGTLKRFDHERGFGFIVPDQGQDLPAQISRDVFCHAAAVERAGCGPLEPGDRLEFDVRMHRGRPEACSIRLLDDAAVSDTAPVRYGAA